MGAVCVGLNDSEDGSSTSDSAHTVAGDSVALLGALFYGLYTTVLKYMVSITAIQYYTNILYTCVYYPNFTSTKMNIILSLLLIFCTTFIPITSYFS